MGGPASCWPSCCASARPLAATLDSEGDPGALRPSLTELLGAASATALEVDRLEATALVVGSELEKRPDGSEAPRMREAVTRCSTAAGTGIQRLLEAVAAVAGIAGRAAALDSGASSRLAALTRDLQQDAEQREAALREVNQLLHT